MKGLNSEITDNSSDSYMTKPRWQRFLIIAAGPLINFISGFIMAVLIFLIFGITETTNTVDQIKLLNPSITENTLLQPGDTITAINGATTENIETISEILRSIPENSEKRITVIRSGQTQEVVLPPGRNIEWTFVIARTDLNLIGASKASGRVILTFIGAQIDFLKNVLTGQTRELKKLSGPIGIFNIGNRLNEQLGVLEGMAKFAFIISIAIGFFNILPIPVLDGGHMLILGIEMAVRKDFSQKFKNALTLLGLLVLMTLMIFIIYNDLLNLARK